MKGTLGGSPDTKTTFSYFLSIYATTRAGSFAGGTGLCTAEDARRNAENDFVVPFAVAFRLEQRVSDFNERRTAAGAPR
jgi:hypothetical protein